MQSYLQLAYQLATRNSQLAYHLATRISSRISSRNSRCDQQPQLATRRLHVSSFKGSSFSNFWQGVLAFWVFVFQLFSRVLGFWVFVFQLLVRVLVFWVFVFQLFFKGLRFLGLLFQLLVGGLSFLGLRSSFSGSSFSKQPFIFTCFVKAVIVYDFKLVWVTLYLSVKGIFKTISK